MPRPRTITVPAAPTSRPNRVEGVRRLSARAADQLTLRLHRLAERHDMIPQEFGKEQPVDETDPRALREEWRRQLRSWAAYNPEEVFAFKVGAVVLVLAMAGLWIGVGVLG